MSTSDAASQKAVILWLSGARLADIRALPETLSDQGALVELDPAPITGLQAQHYQLLSGKLPASFGFFDSFVARNYAVTEQIAGREAAPKLLPDLLRTVGWNVAYEETRVTELASRLQALLQATTTSPACVIVKCVVPQQLDEASASAIARSVQLARQWLGNTGLLALCSETRPAAVKHFVNINNFLAEMGVIERDEQSGQINWPDSLAYFAGNGQLLVNLLGRDAQGAVHPQDEYEEVRDTLVKALPNKLRNPENGEAVIERVYRKEEIYSGDYLFCAPDLVVLFKPGYAPSPHSIRIDFDDAIFTAPTAGETAMAGVHPSLLSGFLLASAPSLAERVTEYEHKPLTAVAPTLLHALGVEYVDMESPAISTLFAPEYMEDHPIRSGTHNQELSAEDEELIISHLRDLGYV